MGSLPFDEQINSQPLNVDLGGANLRNFEGIPTVISEADLRQPAIGFVWCKRGAGALHGYRATSCSAAAQGLPALPTGTTSGFPGQNLAAMPVSVPTTQVISELPFGFLTILDRYYRSRNCLRQLYHSLSQHQHRCCHLR